MEAVSTGASASRKGGVQMEVSIGLSAFLA